MKRTSFLLALTIAIGLSPGAEAQQKPREIHWGDEVPPGWNGKWPAHRLTVPEKTNFTRRPGLESPGSPQIMRLTAATLHCRVLCRGCPNRKRSVRGA